MKLGKPNIKEMKKITKPIKKKKPMSKDKIKK